MNPHYTTYTIFHRMISMSNTELKFCSSHRSCSWLHLFDTKVALTIQWRSANDYSKVCHIDREMHSLYPRSRLCTVHKKAWVGKLTTFPCVHAVVWYSLPAVLQVSIDRLHRMESIPYQWGWHCSAPACGQLPSLVASAKCSSCWLVRHTFHFFMQKHNVGARKIISLAITAPWKLFLTH